MASVVQKEYIERDAENKQVNNLTMRKWMMLAAFVLEWMHYKCEKSMAGQQVRNPMMDAAIT